jgi:putative FmdB family regulatory protein
VIKLPARVARLRKETEMPVYEFQCKCGHITEALVRMDTKAVECPKCHDEARKILSACSFELKGGGWYADGYASSKK